MTIEFQGHVHSLSVAPGDLDVCVELRVEVIRSLHNIKVNASHAEVAHYKPGMPIVIQIRPGAQSDRDGKAMRSITEVPCHCTTCVWCGVTGDCTDSDDDGSLVCPACGAGLVIQYSEEELNPSSEAGKSEPQVNETL